MSPNHFHKIIKVEKQNDLDWICKTHFKIVLKNGKWIPCKEKGNCVIGIHKTFKQLLLFKIN